MARTSTIVRTALLANGALPGPVLLARVPMALTALCAPSSTKNTGAPTARLPQAPRPQKVIAQTALLESGVAKERKRLNCVTR